MRNVGAVNPNVHNDPLLRNDIQHIKLTLRDMSVALGSITTKTNQPTAVIPGDTAFNAANYLYLPGRAGGQTAHGGTGSGEDLTLKATSNPTGGTVIIRGQTTQAENYLDVLTAAGAFVLALSTTTLTHIGSGVGAIKASVTSGATSGTLTPTALTFVSSPSTPAVITAGTLTLDAGTVEVSDAAFRLFDNAVTSKRLAFQLSGITAATTRTLTVQDLDGTIALTSDLTGYLTTSSSPTLTGSWLFANVTNSVSTVIQVGQGPGGGSGLFLEDPLPGGGPFRIEFCVPGAGLTADRSITCPDASITLFGTNTTNTLQNKTMGSGTVWSSSPTVNNSVNLALGTGAGTKIGTGTTQKLGFWNVTPIVQPTTAVAAATFVTNTSLIFDDSATFDGYTIGQVVKALRNAGILA